MTDIPPEIDGSRPLEIVVYGATGFVGKLTADYLARHAPAGARIGLAGRSADRLAAVRAGLGAAAADWPLITADATDPGSLDRMAAGTNVVATTVGPYASYGLPLVEACARAGTHYADLTGEVLFMRDSIERYDGAARATGARIVHSCGFDSIPSDLGTLLLAEAVQADGAGELTDVTLVVQAMRGGFSGGTLASMQKQFEQMSADPSLKRVVGDPYALSPDRGSEPDLGRQPDVTGIGFDHDLGAWTGPFVMAGTNTRVVRRSNALQDHAYGKALRYREVQGYGAGLTAPVKAAGMTAGLGAFAAGMAFNPTRSLLGRVLPKPGSGPSEKSRTSGYFRIDLVGRTRGGARYVCHVAAQGDPGYAATSVMLGESALCLARDGERLPVAAGVLTPATAMGDALVDRLRAAGQTYTVERTAAATDA